MNKIDARFANMSFIPLHFPTSTANIKLDVSLQYFDKVIKERT